MTKPTILITGGAGFIGSHIVKMLQRKGYQPIVIDNLSRGNIQTLSKETLFFEGSVGNQELLNYLFKLYPIKAVMHFAAFIDVGESVQKPTNYYQNNVVETLELLNVMIKHDIKNFIFSSSAAVYGLPSSPLIDETHPCLPINPYGHTKLMIEMILKDFDTAYGMKFYSLRYFNAAGGDPEGEIPFCQPHLTNLIPLILRNLASNSSTTIYGDDYLTKDGTCIRDYVHIDDLGRAHILAMEQLLGGAPSKIYNLGNGQGYSVKEVIHSVEKVIQQPIPVIHGPKRAGDPPILVANSKKVQKELGWIPFYPDIDSMILHALKARQKVLTNV